jgi:hypothetical protein
MNKPSDFSDKSQVGNAVWVFFWIFLIGWCIASLFGCATFEPRSEAVATVIINGEAWTEHTDSPNPPAACGPVGSWQGCRVTSLKRIDYVSPVADWTREHERTEAAGMRHTDYYRGFDNAMCATVTVGLGKYHKGDTICITQAGETIIPATTFAEATK